MNYIKHLFSHILLDDDKIFICMNKWLLVILFVWVIELNFRTSLKTLTSVANFDMIDYYAFIIPNL